MSDAIESVDIDRGKPMQRTVPVLAMPRFGVKHAPCGRHGAECIDHEKRCSETYHNADEVELTELVVSP